MEILSEILGLLGGASVVITGLIAYLGKTRLEAFKSNLTATNNKINAFIDRTTHVSKAQFDKEFEVYQEIWASMISFRQSTLTLRPMLDQAEPDLKERIEKFGQAFTIYRDLIEKNKPFYAESVYEKLYKVLDLCHTEAIEYQSKDDSNIKEYWQGQRKNHEAINTAIEDGCMSIRNRIENLSIIPS